MLEDTATVLYKCNFLIYEGTVLYKCNFLIYEGIALICVMCAGIGTRVN